MTGGGFSNLGGVALFLFSSPYCCGYQVPFPWIVPPHYTQVQGRQRSLTPFREDPRHRPTSVCPPHHNHTRENVPILRCLRTIYFWVGFLVVCSLYKTNPNPRKKNICCGKKWPPSATFNIIFLGLGWPWVG